MLKQGQNNFVTDEVRRSKMEKLLGILSIAFQYNKETWFFIINDKLSFFLSGDLLFFELKFPKIEWVNFEQFNKNFQERYANYNLEIVAWLQFLSNINGDYVQRNTLGELWEHISKGIEDLIFISKDF